MRCEFTEFRSRIHMIVCVFVDYLFLFFVFVVAIYYFRLVVSQNGRIQYAHRFNFIRYFVHTALAVMNVKCFRYPK